MFLDIVVKQFACCGVEDGAVVVEKWQGSKEAVNPELLLLENAFQPREEAAKEGFRRSGRAGGKEGLPNLWC